ncbi:phosphoribosylpyrophosphate synthetase [Clostridium beijerinckii]|nr:phosphoribosylpyrophosphate synthetase [Clostridium beijerinckii]
MSELNHELGIIALESCSELGNAIDKYIQKNRNCTESFLVPLDEIRFSNGEGKVKISESIRGKDIYIYVMLETIAVHIRCLGLKITRVLMNIFKI